MSKLLMSDDFNLEEYHGKREEGFVYFFTLSHESAAAGEE